MGLACTKKRRRTDTRHLSLFPSFSLALPSPRSSLYLSLARAPGGSSLFALLQRSLDCDPSLSKSTLPPLPPLFLSTCLPPASSFAAALSSSALLRCEKGWLLERKRGPSQKGGGRGGGGGVGRSIGGGSATTNEGGQDERWVQRTEPSQLQDN